MNVEGPVPRIKFLRLLENAPLIISISEIKLKEISGGKGGKTWGSKRK